MTHQDFCYWLRSVLEYETLTPERAKDVRAQLDRVLRPSNPPRAPYSITDPTRRVTRQERRAK